MICSLPPDQMGGSRTSARMECSARRLLRAPALPSSAGGAAWLAMRSETGTSFVSFFNECVIRVLLFENAIGFHARWLAFSHSAIPYHLSVGLYCDWAVLTVLTVLTVLSPGSTTRSCTLPCQGLRMLVGMRWGSAPPHGLAQQRWRRTPVVGSWLQTRAVPATALRPPLQCC